MARPLRHTQLAGRHLAATKRSLDVEIVEISMEMADLSFRSLIQARNKQVSAYQKRMRMQI